MFPYLDDMYGNYGNKINQKHALLEHLAMQVVVIFCTVVGFIALSFKGH